MYFLIESMLMLFFEKKYKENKKIKNQNKEQNGQRAKMQNKKKNKRPQQNWVIVDYIL